MATTIGELNAILGMDASKYISETEKAKIATIKMAEDSGKAVRGMISTLATLYAAYKVADFVRDSTMAAARFETLGVVLDRIGQNTSYSKSEINDFVDSLRAMGIAGIEARQVISQMIQSNVDLGQSSKLARVAQDAAVIGNLNSSETMQRMMHAVQANSVEILRTIGLQVNFEAATRKAGLAMGKTVEQMTEREKVQARLNSIIEAGVQIEGSYESAMGTAGKQINSFKRYVQDFEIEFGKAFNPALTQIVFGASEALKTLTDVVKDPKFQADLTKMAGELSSDIVRGMKWLADNKDQVKGYFTGIASGLASIAEVFNKLPMEAWAAILGFAVTRSPVVAGTAAAVAGIYRVTEPDTRDTMFVVQDQIAAQEKSIQYQKDLFENKSMFMNLSEKEKTDHEAMIAALEDQVVARKRGLAILVEQANLVHMLIDEEGKLVDVIDNHQFNMGAKGSAGYKAAFPEPPSKEAEGHLKKFWDTYHKSLDTEFAYETFKLDAQKNEYAKWVTDKAALDRWYYNEKHKLDIKAYGEGGFEVDDKSRGAFRSVIELMNEQADVAGRLVPVVDGLEQSEARLIKTWRAWGDASQVSVWNPEKAEVEIRSMETYVANMKRIREEAEKVYGKGNVVPEQPAMGPAEWEKYPQPGEDYAQRHREVIGAYDQEAVKENAKMIEEQSRETTDYLKELSEQTANSMQKNFSDLFFDAFTGKLKTLEDYADAIFNSIMRMAADLSAQMATEYLFGDMMKGGSGTGALKGAGSWLGSLFNTGGGAAAGGAGAEGFIAPGGMSAKGNAFGPEGLTMFAQGGVVSNPTMFRFARGAGVMGEAGPEGILPLRRGPDGKLGVEFHGSGGGSVTNNVTQVIMAPEGRVTRESRHAALVDLSNSLTTAARRN